MLFLFGGHPKVKHAGSSSKKNPQKKALPLTQNNNEERIYFKGQKNIVLYREAYKSGQIRSANTWAKISPARDELDEDDEDEDEFGDRRMSLPWVMYGLKAAI
jgi:hypothetical protein